MPISAEAAPTNKGFFGILRERERVDVKGTQIAFHGWTRLASARSAYQ